MSFYRVLPILKPRPGARKGVPTQATNKSTAKHPRELETFLAGKLQETAIRAKLNNPTLQSSIACRRAHIRGPDPAPQLHTWPGSSHNAIIGTNHCHCLFPSSRHRHQVSQAPASPCLRFQPHFLTSFLSSACLGPVARRFLRPAGLPSS